MTEQQLKLNDKKSGMIDRIFEHMQPNAYFPAHRNWITTRKALMRLSYRDLITLGVLTLTQTKKEKGAD